MVPEGSDHILDESLGEGFNQQEHLSWLRSKKLKTLYSVIGAFVGNVCLLTYVHRNVNAWPLLPSVGTAFGVSLLISILGVFLGFVAALLPMKGFRYSRKLFLRILTTVLVVNILLLAAAFALAFFSLGSIPFLPRF